MSDLAISIKLCRLGPRTHSLLNAESRGIRGRACFRRSRRQAEVERRATSAVAVGPDPTALRFDYRLADCQAHPAAFRLRRKECVKYLAGLALG
jgi:hypothetical protein